jgi:hypothetical protein
MCRVVGHRLTGTDFAQTLASMHLCERFALPLEWMRFLLSGATGMSWHMHAALPTCMACMCALHSTHLDSPGLLQQQASRRVHGDAGSRQPRRHPGICVTHCWFISAVVEHRTSSDSSSHLTAG